MSRYLEVETGIRTADELVAGLRSLGIAVDVGSERRPILLRDSMECAGTPVEIRVPAESVDGAQDAGFRSTPNGFVLVCGDADRRHLERTLLQPLTRACVGARLRGAAGVHTQQETDGTTRILLTDED